MINIGHLVSWSTWLIISKYVEIIIQLCYPSHQWIRMLIINTVNNQVMDLPCGDTCISFGKFLVKQVLVPLLSLGLLRVSYDPVYEVYSLEPQGIAKLTTLHHLIVKDLHSGRPLRWFIPYIHLHSMMMDKENNKMWTLTLALVHTVLLRICFICMYVVVCVTFTKYRKGPKMIKQQQPQILLSTSRQNISDSHN
jgi:hypothetical protein